MHGIKQLCAVKFMFLLYENFPYYYKNLQKVTLLGYSFSARKESQFITAIDRSHSCYVLTNRTFFTPIKKVQTK